MIAALVGAGWLTYKSTGQPIEQLAPPSQFETKKGVMTKPLWTGVYGDVSQIKDLLHVEGAIVYIEPDADLAGVPCRWLYLANGAAYRTYDMENPKICK